MIKNLILLGVSILLINCETTSPVSIKPEIVIEPSEKIIYQPEKSLPTEKVEEVVVNEIQDFTGIENYQQKPVSSIISNYGSFDYSRSEKLFELHRYNVGKCRIFIQNNTLDKKIVSITIFNINDKIVLDYYKKELCI